MATVKQFKITFKNIKDGELTCENPIVKVFNLSENILQKCEFDTSDNSINVSIYEDALEGLAGTCIQFSVVCESCSKCPSKDGQICFCNNYTDCEECQNCINGLCVNRCPDMLCDEDKCVNCVDSDDCPNNQLCIGGKCQCPPNQPYFDEISQKCYGCETDDECGPCHRCIDGNCVRLNCICDEDLDKCVECVAASDCTLPHQCCVNNKCVCCPGYIFDHILGECIPEPPCTSDEDCEDPCMICVNGNCEPIPCPNPGEICVDGDCVPIPCEGPCDDATDCAGENCGCLDGECVDCASLTCDQCAETVGCKCVNGECEKDTTPCAEYSCDTNCGERPDCGCVDDKCVEVECEGESTLAKNEDECKLEYNLETTKCCECSPITLDNKFTLAQIVGEQLKLTTKVEVRKGSVVSPFGILNIHRVDEDQYDDIMENEEPTQGQVRVTATYLYERLSGAGTPLGIFETEVVNLSPILDVAGVGFQTANLYVNIPGEQYPTGLRVLNQVTLTYTLISELSFESGCVYDQGAVIGTYIFDNTLTGAELKTDINTKTPGQDSNANYWIAQTIESEACRNPEARWYKAEANEDGSIGVFEEVPFRKTYLTKLTPTTYTDFIDEPDENPGPTDNNGELFSGYYYKVATDCACINEATAYYESTCANPGRLVFCDPQTADIEFDACGKKITFNESFITDCLPNYDYYGDNADFVPDEAQLRYSIHVNGSDTALTGSTKIADINGLIYNAGQIFNATELIEFIEIRFSHDNCDECTIRIDSDVDLDLPSYSVICEPSGASNTTFIITFTGWTGIDSVTVNGNVATPGSPTINVTVVNGTTSLTGAVQFDGCSGTVPMTIQLPENCCDDLTVSLTQSTTDCDGDTYDFVALASPNIPGTYSFSVNGVFASSNSTGIFSTNKNIGGDEPDTVSVNFNPTAEGCDNVINSVEVDKTNTITINSNRSANYATCGTDDVFITYSADGYSGTVTVTISGVGSTEETLDGTEDLVITVPYSSGGRTVTITETDLEDEDGNTCINLNPNITNVSWVETPEVTSVTINPSSGCEGDAVTVTVNGTIGGTATINSVNFIGVTPTTVNMNTPYTFYLGSYLNSPSSVTATEAQAGDCEEDVNVGDTVIVNDKPEITSVDYVCETPGNPSSAFDITVIGTAASVVTVVADEGNVVLAESPAGTYTGNIDASNGGDSVTVNMVKGSCSDSETIPIVSCGCDEDAEVVVELLGDVITEDDACVGVEHTFVAVASGGNPSYDYVWRLNNPISGTQMGTSDTLIYEFTPGSSTLWVVVTDAEGCEFQTSISLVGHAIPTATINGDLTPCLNEATNYTVSYTNGPISSYQWQLDGVDTVTTATYAYTPVDTDPHDISVVVTNSNTCESSETTIETNAVDCCVICEEDWTFVKDAISYNRLKDTSGNVYTLSPAIVFECVNPGDPSASNDDAVAELQSQLEDIATQCGTPLVSWETWNVGDDTECLSETFSIVSGTSGIWFRGLIVNGTTYNAVATKIANATAGTITSIPSTAESAVEVFTATQLQIEDVGVLTVNWEFAIGAPTTELDVSAEITGITGATVSFLYSTTIDGGTTTVAINDAICTALGGDDYPTPCVKVTVEGSSIIPFQLYNSLDSDPNNKATFVGPCNGV
jgi:hypothetical protein